MEDRLTVIIPMYNEQSRIAPTLAEIHSYAKKHPGVIQSVICVDDGSTDGTVEWVMRYADKLPVKVIRHAKNEGKWAAVQTGLSHAKGLVLLMDADGSASIWELERGGFSYGLPKKGFAVFGTRYGYGAKVEGKSLMRSIVSRGYRAYVSMMYGLAGGRHHISDMQCPLKIFYVEDVRGRIVTKRFAGDIELALRLDAIVLNHGVDFHHVRGSKVPLGAAWNMFKETARISRLYRTGRLNETIK